MSEILTPVVYQLGIGGIGGFIVGYAIKKIVKIIVIIFGLFFLILIYLGYIGVISVGYDRLAEALSGAIPLIEQAPGFLILIISNLPFAGSFIFGFTLGLKKG